jgi:hypothetical protein
MSYLAQKMRDRSNAPDPEWDKVMEFAINYMTSHDMNVVEFCYRCTSSIGNRMLLLQYSRALTNRIYRPYSNTSRARQDFIRASIEGLDETKILVVNESYINDCLQYHYTKYRGPVKVEIYDNIIKIIENCYPGESSIDIPDGEEVRVDLITWFPTYTKLANMKVEKESRMYLIDML